LAYSSRLLSRLERGVYNTAELTSLIRAKVVELLFSVVVDVLSFRGDV